jgi:type VI secretion system protein ImpG
MSLMMGGSIRAYFLEELRGLREDADHFARDYPAVARELAISRGRSKDPQVELLMQSFAYLTGRLQYRLDEERANLPNVLLGQLYPHLQTPLPCMTVAHIDVQPDGANFSGGWLLSRGRQLLARASNGKGRTVDCRFSTCYDTWLWPLSIRQLGLTPTNHYDFLSQDSSVQSVLRIQLGVLGHDPIQGLGIDSLRFHIQGDSLTAFALYDLLATHCVGLAVRSCRDGQVRRLGPEALQWLGFTDDEAVLPASPLTHPGYRLLQEYFAFREKFLFFELRGLDCSDAIDELELLLLLDRVPPKGLQLRHDNLALNCVPIVNLYPQALEPLRLDQRDYEYRLLGDAANHDYCEIHSLLELAAIQPDAAPRPVAPYFSVQQAEQLQAQDYFYVTRRAESQFKSVPGTELFVSFLDTQLDLSRPPADTITGRALCTNRRLPEQLSAGDHLQLEGAGPVSGIRLSVKPTTHKTPGLLGAEPWALLSQLSLNHLSLDGDPRALEAFKRILTLNADPGTPSNLREIEAIRRLDSRPVVQHLGKDFWRGLSRGERIRLEVDEEAFYGGTAVLFAEVLQHFFSLFANVNTFTQLALESKQRKETWKLWPPMVGARPVL